jgi:hypothetical protein
VAGSGGSSSEDSRLPGTSSSDVDPSSSEQSADTVIYVGPSDDQTDGEHPPVYIPSLNSGDNRCAMGKALRGSSAERQPSSLRGSPAKSKLPSSAEGSPAKSAKSSKIPVRPSGATPKSPQIGRQVGHRQIFITLKPGFVNIYKKKSDIRKHFMLIFTPKGGINDKKKTCFIKNLRSI